MHSIRGELLIPVTQKQTWKKVFKEIWHPRLSWPGPALGTRRKKKSMSLFVCFNAETLGGVVGAGVGGWHDFITHAQLQLPE